MQTNERTADVLAQLEAGISAILDSDAFAAYLRTMAKFHAYSFSNVLLILAQRPDATRVAGYKVTGFGVASVFDLSQTDGEELPSAPSVAVLDGDPDLARAVSRRLTDALTAEGVTVSRELAIIVRADLPMIDATATLLHEAAHFHAAHQPGIDRHDAETVAECAAPERTPDAAPPATAPMLTVPQVAARLNVGESSVHRWCRDGTLPSRKLGGSRRVHRADLDAFLDSAAG